jgi:hypothetical protein
MPEQRQLAQLVRVRSREGLMTTGDIVRERALELARSETDREQAVSELLTSCGGRRVAAVSARQQLVAWLNSEPDQRDAMRAVEFLDELLEKLPA